MVGPEDICFQGSMGDYKIMSSCSAEGVVIAHLLISAVKKLLPNDYTVKFSPCVGT